MDTRAQACQAGGMSKHVLIIGGGIVGASTAFALSRAGARVSLLERHAPAAGASSKSFAWLNANYPDTEDYFSLRLAALAHYRALAADFDLSGLLRFGGSLWWEDEGEDFDAHVALLERFDYDCHVVERRDFAALVPAILNPPERALLAPREAGVDLAGLTRWMLTQASAAGASVQTGSGVDGLETLGGRVVGVRTALERIEADAVVLAAGTVTGSLLSTMGLHLPMANNAGLILRSAPQPALLDHVIMSPDVHFRQDPDGTILMGEIFSGAFEPGRDIAELRADVLGRVAQRLRTLEPLTIAQATLGTRPMPVDGLPAVGTLPGLEGLHVAVMHSAATLGPMIGEMVAREVLTGEAVPDLATFRPGRFDLQPSPSQSESSAP